MNFGLRLDEILSDVHRKHYDTIDGTDGCKGSILEAKQALTSLIKELVAEAKPEDNCMDCNGVMQFEQNLLKALEDK